MAEENEILDISGDGGVKKQILKEGIGSETPGQGCKVALHYICKLMDGTILDTSYGQPQPFEIKLGKDSVIEGFSLGITTMKLLEKCTLFCSPNYAYGQAGSPPKIPPNSTIIFEIELLGWMGEDISPDNDGSIERYILKKSEKKRTPTEGAFVKAHISGIYEDKPFENRDVEFCLDEGSAIGIIEGVEKALEKMAVGEISRFYIKSKYAFGAKGNEQYGIPPNATVKYIIELIECEKPMSDWKYSNEERFENAKIYKEKGTKYFKNENYSLAIKMYKKCVNVLNDNNDKESNNLRIAAYSNQALCYQKTNEQFEGKRACDEALKLEPTNIKALYRRGQCNLATNEYSEALEDFQKLLHIDPSNKAAQNQIQISKQKLKDTCDKEKKIYANMFTKLAAANKELDIPIETDVLSKCDEWTEELGNNNVVMI